MRQPALSVRVSFELNLTCLFQINIANAFFIDFCGWFVVVVPFISVRVCAPCIEVDDLFFGMVV